MQFRNVGVVPDDAIAFKALPPCQDKQPSRTPSKPPATTPPITFDWTDLPGQSLAETTGTSITLDTTAANYGWFLDPTPDTNEEFLPTSNPNEWQAKPGSDAAGHMDLLSVLWHEVGHTLGLDHTTNAHDFMAATLAPGVRRLPTAEEMARLAAMLPSPLGGGAGGEGTTLAQPSTPDQAPFPHPGPLPGGEGGIALSALLLGRLRTSQYGTWTPAFASVQAPAPQPWQTRYEQSAYDVAANPAFIPLPSPAGGGGAGGEGTGWTPTGTVTFANAAATLSESATTQTRLNQIFILGQNDRRLRFTLAGIALDHPDGAPGDAFEVALTDANTHQPLLDGLGLSHSDAFLNLQADGTLHLGSGVTRTLNPDGSLVIEADLSGLAAGTVASLSFDLIGFGLGTAASNSHTLTLASRVDGWRPVTAQSPGSLALWLGSNGDCTTGDNYVRTVAASRSASLGVGEITAQRSLIKGGARAAVRAA
jgi:hypothetical protein